MNYVVSENGKYFYKVGKDGKKARVSKEEYEKKAKPCKSKKVGGDPIVEEKVSWAMIMGSSGNLSPSVKAHLEQNGITDITVYSGSDYNLKTDKGIEKLKTDIKTTIKNHEGKKGAFIFVSAERDPMMFFHCQNAENYEKYKKDINPREKTLSYEEKQKELWNFNMKAPIDVFNSISQLKNMIFVYISTIYVFKGDVIKDTKPVNLVRTEDIKNSALDFIDVDVNIALDANEDTLKGLFSTHGKNLYAYGKRYVELKLYEEVATDGMITGFNNKPDKAKVVILRMDGITPENPIDYGDGTFLLALSKKDLACAENRYPVFPTQISKVIIGAINTFQKDNIKVYHVAGTEKNKGLTKEQMVLSIIKPKQKVTIDRKMSDSNSLAVAKNYEDGVEGEFIKKLEKIYGNLVVRKRLPSGGARRKKH